jgi:TfoX/Sxy family transcriptional regulator of competence genes
VARWKKSPPDLVEAFDALVSPYGRARRRSMFGYPAAFLAGNMVCGLHEDRLVLRLDPRTAATAKKRGARDFEPMPGRCMRGWIAVPRQLVANHPLVERWLESAFRHAAALPAKQTEPKARSRKA